MSSPPLLISWLNDGIVPEIGRISVGQLDDLPIQEQKARQRAGPRHFISYGHFHHHDHHRQSYKLKIDATKPATCPLLTGRKR